MALGKDNRQAAPPVMNRRDRRRFAAQLGRRIRRLPFCFKCRRPKQPRNWEPEENLAKEYCSNATCSHYEIWTKPVDEWPSGEKIRPVRVRRRKH